MPSFQQNKQTYNAQKSTIVYSVKTSDCKLNVPMKLTKPSVGFLAGLPNQKQPVSTSLPPHILLIPGTLLQLFPCGLINFKAGSHMELNVNLSSWLKALFSVQISTYSLTSPSHPTSLIGCFKFHNGHIVWCEGISSYHHIEAKQLWV